MTVQLITDGVHVHEAVMRLVYRTFGPDRIAVITDGMQPMGLEDGIYVYNGVEYESSKGTARYMDGTLIGASLGQIEMMKRYMDFIGCSLGDAVLSGSYVPAQVLGLGDKKGSLEKSKDADIVLIDDDFGVFKTIVGGNTVFSTENS